MLVNFVGNNHVVMNPISASQAQEMEKKDPLVKVRATLLSILAPKAILLSMLTSKGAILLSQVNTDCHKKIKKHLQSFLEKGITNEQALKKIYENARDHLAVLNFRKKTINYAELDNDAIAYQLFTQVARIFHDLTKTPGRKQEVLTCLNQGPNREFAELSGFLERYSERTQEVWYQRWSHYVVSEKALNEVEQSTVMNLFQLYKEVLWLFLKTMDSEYRGAAVIFAAGTGQQDLIRLLLAIGPISPEARQVALKKTQDASIAKEIEECTKPVQVQYSVEEPTREVIPCFTPKAEFPVTHKKSISDHLGPEWSSLLFPWLTCQDGLNVALGNHYQYHQLGKHQAMALDRLKEWDDPHLRRNWERFASVPVDNAVELSRTAYARAMFVALGVLVKQLVGSEEAQETFADIMHTGIALEKRVLRRRRQRVGGDVPEDVRLSVRGRWTRLETLTQNIIDELGKVSAQHVFEDYLYKFVFLLKQMDPEYRGAALSEAVKEGNLLFCDLLLEMGAVAEASLEIALMEAVSDKREVQEILQLLLKTGTYSEEVLLKALENAKDNGYPDSIRLLQASIDEQKHN